MCPRWVLLECRLWGVILLRGSNPLLKAGRLSSILPWKARLNGQLSLFATGFVSDPMEGSTYYIKTWCFFCSCFLLTLAVFMHGHAFQMCNAACLYALEGAGSCQYHSIWGYSSVRESQISPLANEHFCFQVNFSNISFDLGMADGLLPCSDSPDI